MDNRPRPRRFTPIDSTWLHMELPASTTLIGGLLLFDEPVDFDCLRAQLVERLYRFDRFRQRPRVSRLPLALPTWDPVPDFDWDSYIRCVNLPQPGGWAELKAFIESLLRAPLPRDRPIWRMFFIQRYGRGSALVTLYSHILADGFASMHLLEALTDPAPGAAPPALALAPELEPEPGTEGLAARLAAALDAADAARRLPGRAFDRSLELARNPHRALRQVNWGAGVAEALLDYVVRMPDRWTPLRGLPSQAKRVAVSDPILLAELKAVGQAFGASVNDVLAAAVSGGFRRYLIARGEQVDGLTIHAMMPYNMRPPERSNELGNGFATVFVPLPVGISNPVDRLAAVKGGIDAIKGRPEADMSWIVMRAAGFLPEALSRLAIYGFGIKNTTVLTNVPGLPEARYLAGRRISRVMFWVPMPCFASSGTSLLTYAGNATICVASDARMVPDPEAIVVGFAAEYTKLKERAGLC